MRGLLAICFLTLAVIACNMDASGQPTNIPPTGEAAMPTWEVDAATLAACQPRADWVAYTIQRRDSLTTIASAVGSTVDELAEGNCLQNRNRIVVGETLLVPHLPDEVVVNTACDTTLYNPVTSVDTVQITPVLRFSDACYVLAADVPITITWSNTDAGVVEVTFYRYNDQLPRPDVIGVDNTPADGFSIQWTPFPEMPPSIIYAIALGGSIGSDPDPVGVVIGE